MKGIQLSVEAYRPNKDNEGWERKLLQQEPDTIVVTGGTNSTWN